MAKNQWDKEKGIIYHTTRWMRDKIERFRPDKLSREARMEFETKHRGSERQEDNIPLIYKFWKIHDQIRRFHGHEPKINALGKSKMLNKLLHELFQLRMRR